MREAVVEQEVKTYFTDRFPQFSVSQQVGVQFGTKHGIADVVLHQPIGEEKGQFIAIAEVKRWPLPILRYRDREAPVVESNVANLLGEDLAFCGFVSYRIHPCLHC